MAEVYLKTLWHADPFQKNSTILRFWTVEKFRFRLEAMRDLYIEVCARNFPWGQPGDPNPWADSATWAPASGPRDVLPHVGQDEDSLPLFRTQP